MSVIAQSQNPSGSRLEHLGKWLRRRKTSEALYGFAFVLPAVVGFLAFHVGPIVVSLGMSFFKASLTTSGEWLGLGNYREMVVEDWVFWTAMKNGFTYALATVPISTALQLVLATMLNRGIRGGRGVSVFRMLLYLPTIVPSAAIAFMWVYIYNPQFGLANFLLGAVGLPRQMWLSSTKTALPSLMLISIWGGLGPGLVMFLAGLQSISQHYYEAAEIDGAGSLAKFWYITMPLVSPVTFLSVVIGLINALQLFDLVFIATQGGPRHATLSINLYVYQNAFELLRFGYAAAVAWALAVVIFVLTFVQFRLQRRWVQYGG